MKTKIIFILLFTIINSKTIVAATKVQQRKVASIQTKRPIQKTQPKITQSAKITQRSVTPQFPFKKPQTFYPSQSIQSNLSAVVAKQAAQDRHKLEHIHTEHAATPIFVPIAVPVATTLIENPPLVQQNINVEPVPKCVDNNLNVANYEQTKKSVISEDNCPIQCSIELPGSCYNSLYNQMTEDNQVTCGCGIVDAQAALTA